MTKDSKTEKQYEKRQDSLIATYSFRPISHLITPILVKLPLTPNWISFISFVFTVSGAILILFINANLYWIVVILILGGTLLDYCDGDVARRKNLSSKFGALWDPILDRLEEPILIFLIAFKHYQNTNDYFFLIAAYFTAFAVIFADYSVAKQKQVYSKIDSLATSISGNMNSKLLSNLLSFYGGDFVRIILIIALFLQNQMIWLYLFLGGIALFWTFSRILFQYILDKKRK